MSLNQQQRDTLSRAAELKERFDAFIFPVGSGQHRRFRKLESFGYLKCEGHGGHDIDGEVEGERLMFSLTDAGLAVIDAPTTTSNRLSGLFDAPAVRRLKVGVICECSGRVRDAFRRLGHDAISCDLKPTRKPGPHIQGDCFHQDWRGFDLLIMHPVCTFLTSSAEWAYGDGPYHQKVKPGTLTGAARRAARDKAVENAKRLMLLPVSRLAMENPVGCLSTRYRETDQTIQPYNFGDDASKRTCLWLKGLPLLQATSYCEPRIVIDAKGVSRKRWANQTDSGQNRLSPSDNRDELRSNTYPGIAAAMAMQWGGVVADSEVAL